MLSSILLFGLPIAASAIPAPDAAFKRAPQDLTVVASGFYPENADFDAKRDVTYFRYNFTVLNT